MNAAAKLRDEIRHPQQLVHLTQIDSSWNSTCLGSKIHMIHVSKVNILSKLIEAAFNMSKHRPKPR